jgi:hypothetical protein
VSGDVLFVAGNSSLRSFSKSTRVVLDTAHPVEADSLAVVPSTGRIFVRKIDLLTWVDFAPDGSLDVDFHAVRIPSQGPDLVLALPDEELVLDGSGSVFSTADLAWRGSLQGTFDDAAFAGGRAVMLRDGELRAYDLAALHFPETGRYALTLPAQSLFADGETLWAFGEADPPSAAAFHAEPVPLASLVPPPPATPVDPETAAFAPQDFAIDGQHRLYLLDAPTRSIFRWSLSERAWLETLTFHDAPARIAYSPANDRVYVGFETGAVIDLDPTQPSQQRHFFALPGPSCAIESVGANVFLCGTTRFWSYATLDADRNVLDQERGPSTAHFAWGGARRRLYHLFQNSLPEPLCYRGIGDNGDMDASSVEVPWHGVPIAGPLRLAPDESAGVLGSGAVFDPETLAKVAALPSPVRDAAWSEGRLATVRGGAVQTRIEVWTGGYALDSYGDRPGLALRLLRDGDDLWLVSRVGPRPAVTLLDLDDLDGDGVPRAEDAFPSDPAEHADLDGDGVGDNADAFPDDPEESADADGDGVGDNGDVFPSNPAESADFDGDGVGDDADAFPLDGQEWEDTDGDGIGDNADPDPYGEPFLALELEGFEQLRLGRLRPSDLPNRSRFGLLEDGRVVACDPDECFLGTHAAVGRSGRRFSMTLDPASTELTRERLEAIFLTSLERDFGVGNVEVDVRLRIGRERGSIAVSRSGRARVAWKLPFEATLTLLDRGLSVTRRGVYAWKFEGFVDAPSKRPSGSP